MAAAAVAMPNGPITPESKSPQMTQTVLPVSSSPVSTVAAAATATNEERENVSMVHLRVLIISGQYHVFSFAPETTVGRMKELVWSMWPSEWSSPAQPPSPSHLRVLYAGRILSDDSTLLSNGLPTSMSPSHPTVIHLSVRCFSIRGEDDPKKPSLGRASSSRDRNQQDEEVGGCKCIIM